MNYTQLTTAIKGFAENDFPATVGSFTSAEQIARFVQLAEQRIYNMVQLPAIRKNVTGNMTSGNRFLATPSDWLSTFSLAVINAANETSYLLNKDVNFIRESYPDTDKPFMQNQSITLFLTITPLFLGLLQTLVMLQNCITSTTQNLL